MSSGGSAGRAGAGPEQAERGDLYAGRPSRPRREGILARAHAEEDELRAPLGLRAGPRGLEGDERGVRPLLRVAPVEGEGEVRRLPLAHPLAGELLRERVSAHDLDGDDDDGLLLQFVIDHHRPARVDQRPEGEVARVVPVRELRAIRQQLPPQPRVRRPAPKEVDKIDPELLDAARPLDGAPPGRRLARLGRRRARRERAGQQERGEENRSSSVYEQARSQGKDISYHRMLR